MGVFLFFVYLVSLSLVLAFNHGAHRERRTMLKNGEIYHVDCPFDWNEDGHDMRLVDDVEVLLVSDKDEYVMVYSPLLKADIILEKTDLREK